MFSACQASYTNLTGLTTTAGALSESQTMTFPLAQSFTEQSHSPLASVDIILTGAREQDPPPRVSHGMITVHVRISAQSPSQYAPLYSKINLYMTSCMPGIVLASFFASDTM
jgi:hypothetical protein